MSLRFNPVVIPDATTYSVKEYNSGLLHVVPDLTANCTITLPSPKKGLSYRFMYGGAAADASDFIISTGSASNYFVGGIVWLDNDSATDNVAAVFSDGNSNDTFTVVTPDGGTSIELISDGTVWYLNGTVVSATTPTIAD